MKTEVCLLIDEQATLETGSSRMKGKIMITKPFRTLLCIALCLSISHFPEIATASMISTSTVVAQIDEAQAQQRVQQFVNSGDVQKLLLERGVSPEEAKARLATLSEKELQQLAGQVEEARAGGDILMVILIVVLIIFLIKRI
jgi:hypothetical protein